MKLFVFQENMLRSKAFYGFDFWFLVTSTFTTTNCTIHQTFANANNVLFLKHGGCTLIDPLKEFEKHVNLHLQSWQHLAHYCQRNGMFLFRLRPKTHYLQHIGTDVRRHKLNPRLVSACFYDESFLGYIKRVATMCHSSTMVRERFWQRYFMLLAVRFQRSRACSTNKA